VVLIEHAGDVVTRDALRTAIWGDDTFVDFDKGLNFAIAQVRTALGDSADAPTYVRTFPKRGYQFVAPVENESRPQGAQGFSPAEPRSPEGLRHNRLGLLAAASIVVLALIGGVWNWSARSAEGPSHTIAVARFDNQTGLADYDRYAQDLTDALVAELTVSGAGRFAIIGNAAALRAPRDRRDLVEIGDSLKAGYIVLGQVQREGERVRVLAHLIRLPEQKHSG
jgi:TolB-like protein